MGERRVGGSKAGKGTTRFERARLERLLDGFGEVRLLVAGDVVLDEYLWGEVNRVSPEAPVPVVHVQRESIQLGGAGNVVRNVLAMGGRCGFCTVVGDDADGREVIQLLKELDVDAEGVVVAEGRPTTRKTRVTARSQQVVRFDRETTEALPAAVARRALAAITAALPGAGGAILADYGKGFFARRWFRTAMSRLRDAGVAIAVDPKFDLTPFRGATLLKPNLREAEALTGLDGQRPGELGRMAERLRRAIGGGDIVVTRGSAGSSVFEAGRPPVEVPTVPQEVFDVQGAGDTSIAALAMSLCAGASLPEAALIANAAAGVVVEKIGTATATRDEVREFIPRALAAVEEAS